MMEQRRSSEGGNKGFYQALPKGIWALGFVSMFTDISSELVHSLLPIFITTTLGASMVTLGILEGLAEATNSIAKVFSGLISDYFRRRKYLVLVGYGLAVLSKPLFPLARSMVWVFVARFLDRIGKGIRVAPRDALVSELAPPYLWGAAYGLRQALDSVGAFLGPLLALVLMSSFSDNIRAVLWVAVIPGLISICLLIFGVKEPESRKGIEGSKSPISLRDTKRLGLRYWLVIALGGIFALARFSEAFLILRAQDLGMAVGYVPIIMVVMNVTYSLFAYPAGAAADRFSASTLLLFGLMVLVFSDIVLAVASSQVLALVGSGLWGIHMAFTQGLFSKLIADNAPSDLRGTAFGVFNLVSGAALLMASVVAGSLWNIFGAKATFYAGAVFGLLAAFGLLLYRFRVKTK